MRFVMQKNKEYLPKPPKKKHNLKLPPLFNGSRIERKDLSQNRSSFDNYEEPSKNKNQILEELLQIS